jgi:hypothetical protein
VSAEQSITNARLAIQAISDRDWSFIPKLLAPNFIRHDLSGAFDEISGHKGMGDFMELVIKAMGLLLLLNVIVIIEFVY